MKYKVKISGEQTKNCDSSPKNKRDQKTYSNKALRKSKSGLEKVDDLDDIYAPSYYKKRRGWVD